MSKKHIIIILAVIAAAAVIVLAAGFAVSATGWTGSDYTVKELDLSAMPEDTPEEYRPLYDLTVVDDGADYLAHPDSVLLKDGKILTLYPPRLTANAIRLNGRRTDGCL